MSLGSTLRAAREAHGITTSELAARTHMLVQIVEGLENEDFRRIPAPIYGRGFIKLYCEAVNLDPKPLQAEFMDLFNRAKNAPEKVDIPQPVRRTATPPAPPPPVDMPPPAPELPPQPVPEEILQPAPEVTPQPEPVSVTQPVQEEAAQDFSQPARQTDAPIAHEPPPADDLGDLFAAAARQEPLPPPAQPISSQPPPKRTYGDLFGQAYADEEKDSKPSAAEKFRNTMSNVSSGVFANVQKLPRNTGRIVMVAGCGILLLAFLCWGVSALYKATSTPRTDTAVPTQETEDRKPEAKEEAPVKKTSDSKKQQSETTKAKSGQTAKPVAASSDVSVKPSDLKSSGIEVPALYID